MMRNPTFSSRLGRFAVLLALAFLLVIVGGCRGLLRDVVPLILLGDNPDFSESVDSTGDRG